jgi:hypothetical protein
MDQELITKAMKMFDTYEKWNAFIELSNSKQEIRKRYFERLKTALISHFVKDVNDSWGFTVMWQEQYRWFIREYGPESICLLWRVQDLVLWCNAQYFDAQLVNEALNSPEFNPIFNCFTYTDTRSSTALHHFCEEKHRFNFEDSTSYSGPDEENADKLAWFAGIKTEEMVRQIATQVNKFRTEEITTLLRELNRRCKKT